MLGIGQATKVYVAAGAVDMRKGFEVLYGLVRDVLGGEPLSGHMFLFANRSRTRLKILFCNAALALEGLKQMGRKLAENQVHNGPECVGSPFQIWCKCNGVQVIHFQSDKPTQHGKIERFNGRLWNQCRDEHHCEDPEDDRKKVGTWRQQYLTKRHTQVSRNKRRLRSQRQRGSRRTSPRPW